MSRNLFSLVNVWTDPEPGPGGFNPMAASLLWTPEQHQAGLPAPAFVYIGHWSSYPYAATPAEMGPAVADLGCGFLSLCLRRRGVGQLMTMPDDDLRDIKLAIDYLHTNGFSGIYLIGDGIGGNSAIRYMAKHKDNRVRGITWLNPIADPPDWLAGATTGDSYQQQMQLAGLAARQGAGMSHRVDLFPTNAPPVTQYAMAFLSWFGQLAQTRLQRPFADLSTPLQVVGEQVPGDVSAALAANDNRTQVSKTDAAQLVDWAAGLGAELLDSSAPQLVTVESAGQLLTGLYWLPADGKQTKTVTMLVHGLSSSPLSPLYAKMAPVLAQSGTAVLAIEMRRSNWEGHERALMEFDTEDIDVWVQYLLAQGYEKIVLAGASLGSVSIGRYQSLHQQPNVVGLAHLMPTADCPGWFRIGVGDGPYEQAVARAEAAVAAGDGDTALIDIDMRQPPPNKYGGTFRWTQRAASWLSWFGPNADSVNSQHMANAHVPILLLSGTDDSYNDAARFAELKAAAVNAPSVDEVWYPNIDHGLVGVETQTARDVLAWMQKIGAVD